MFNAKRAIMAVIVCATPGVMHAQFDFNLFDRPVQVHSFGSQGFADSNDNNYLTMKTSSGSFAFTDFGFNASSQITDSFRVGAQFYDRNIGQLGKWQPQLDWAQGDYKFKDWFGIRAGKVKTALGLYNDSQDVSSLHTWAILPQSMYALDLRGTDIAHIGGDIYGTITPKGLGSFAYTAYAGQTPEDPTGGYVYGLTPIGLNISSYAGRVSGGDLRWNTPLAGLTIGSSLLEQNIVGAGTRTAGGIYTETSRKNYVEQDYTQYIHGSLRVDGEYRRYYRDQIANGIDRISDNRSWYIAGAYRVTKHLELGSYWSRWQNWSGNVVLPTDHLYDKVVTARVDLTSHWNVKLEGHFMDGYGAFDSLQGFYAAVNPQGLVPKTNMLVIRTGFSF